jgi:hypothetical protein
MVGYDRIAPARWGHDSPGDRAHAAIVAKALKSMTLTRLYAYGTLLEGLAQDLEHMTAKLGPFIQEEHTVVRRRHHARHRHVAPADQPDIRDGIVGSATRVGRDQRRAVAGESGDARDAGGLDGLRRRQCRQKNGKAACPRIGGTGPAVRWAWGTTRGLQAYTFHVHKTSQRTPLRRRQADAIPEPRPPLWPAAE